MRSLKVGRHHQVPGEFYGTPKEIWGFRSPRATTAPRTHARNFLRANLDLYQLPSLREFGAPRSLTALGATHVLFPQEHLNRRIHRGYVTVHMGRDGRIYLSKNRAVPESLLPDERAPRFTIGKARARARARRQLRGVKGRVRTVGAVEEVWYPRRTELLPAYKIRLHCEKPRHEWIIFVDARNGTVLDRNDNLSFLGGIGTVFLPNPVVVLDDWRALKGPRKTLRRPPMSSYRVVALEGLDASGRLDGRNVTTSLTPKRVRRADRRFLFSAHEPAFEEVMVYYHVDRAIEYLKTLGYTGRHAIFKQKVRINARGTRDDNSWYSPGEKTLTFGTGGVDDAEDAEIILHEFGHALQDAICPDFGQSEEAAAMGEGFGDYFAASFFAGGKGSPWQPCVMSWDAVRDCRDGFPALRRVDGIHGRGHKLTFRHYEEGGDCHDNGSIWAATLWDIFTALGREVADRIIIESHFQLDGFTKFARGARAILDADRNLYRGRHQRRLRAIFRDRKIPLL